MTATIKGVVDLQKFLAELPDNLEQKVLRGALRAGAKVLADEAKQLCRSEEVRDSIGITGRAEKGLVTAKVQTKGKGAYLAPWLEYGTDPHFISVDDSQSGGRTVRRINLTVPDHESLMINGKFVGKTVHHPGAKSYPFMRPAIDNGQGAAVAAIGNYIAARLTKEGLAAPAPPEDPEE